MDNEYDRILKSDYLSSLFECKTGYMDVDDCSWYHHNWMLLRYLGMVSNPFWHENFYLNAIKKYLCSRSSVLILGTADFSMPYLCQQTGINALEISDICKTPLNICKNVSEHHGFTWKTKQQNIFDGISAKYDAILNDAFITRFSYNKKRRIFEEICNGLVDGGVYITTLRHGWNNGNPIIPTENEKQDFINKTVHSASVKKVNTEVAKLAASQYIERISSYPIRDEEMLQALIAGLFTIEQIDKKSVKGECVPTEYYNIVLRKDKL